MSPAGAQRVWGLGQAGVSVRLGRELNSQNLAKCPSRQHPRLRQTPRWLKCIFPFLTRLFTSYRFRSITTNLKLGFKYMTNCRHSKLLNTCNSSGLLCVDFYLLKSRFVGFLFAELPVVSVSILFTTSNEIPSNHTLPVPLSNTPKLRV